jgi:hypothetical protein
MRPNHPRLSGLGSRASFTLLAGVCLAAGAQACASAANDDDDAREVPAPGGAVAESPDPGQAISTAARVPYDGSASPIYKRYRELVNIRPLRAATEDGPHDTLSEYAAKCDLATGIHVPKFSCDQGVEVPGQGFVPRGTLCPTPNVLNERCDPGSKFQVLVQTEDAAAVAHCRKDGLEISGSDYNDVAVIQYNKKNGAVCYYQALGYDDGALDGAHVAPPSEGEPAWRWLPPERTEKINCTGCHDNGGFIRSPYLAQLDTLPDVLPSVAAGFTNHDTPLKYVGNDFVKNRSWSVTTATPTSCTSCHRLGVNNYFAFGRINGTAGHFADFATAASQPSKFPHSPQSPIWMTPGATVYDLVSHVSALAYQACAVGFWEGQNQGFSAGTPVPGCTFTPLGTTWDGFSPAQLGGLL